MASAEPFTSWGLGWKLSWVRVAKYKQRRQLYGRFADKLKQGGALDALKNGACTALSFAWITSHKANPKQAPVDRLESFNSDADFLNHQATAKYFNTHGGTYAARVALAANHTLGTVRADVVNMTEANMATFNGAVAHLDKYPGYHMVLMDITNFATNHVFAVYANDDEMIVFDPNFGEFTVANANRGAFFVNLKSQYETYVNKDNVKTKLEFDNGWDFNYLP